MKKAQANGYIVAGIVVLILMLLYFGLFYRAESYVENKPRLILCREYVKANALSRWGEYVKNINIICPTENVVIKSTDETEIKETIAKKMKEGFDLFKPEEGYTKWELFDKNAVYCYTNAIISFEGRIKPINGMTDYLITHEISPGETYMDYLSGSSPGETLSKLTNFKDTSEIDPLKKYAVVVVYAKGKDPIDNFFKKMNSASGQVTLIGAGVAGSVAIYAGLIAAGPVGWVTIGIAKLAAVGAIVSATYNYFFGESADVQWVLMSVLKEYTQESLAELGCEILPVRQSATK